MTGPGRSRGYTERVPPARSEPMERLMLLDGNGLIYRGYFALAAPDDVEGRARQRGVRLLQHRPARRSRTSSRTTSRSPSTCPARPSATSSTPSTRPPRTRMPDDLRDQFPKVREVVKALRIPVYELAGLRGRRRHRHAHGRGRAARPRHDDRDRRPRHAPARHRPHPADDDSLRASRTRSSTTSPRSTSGSACGPTR